MKKSYLMDMTWQEFESALNDKSVLMIPMGSAELEGLHLPLGVDTIMAEGLAVRLAGTPRLIICPPLPIGYSKWFMPFPGTITLEQDTLVHVLLDYCRSLISHGARRILFLNSHAGNSSAVETASRILQSEAPVLLSMIETWRLAGDLIAGKGLIDEDRFTHAGELMTSAIMTLKPETVVTDKIRADKVKTPAQTALKTKNSLGAVMFNHSTQTLYRDIRDVTDTGTMGDPTAANAEKGEKVLEMTVEYVKAFIAEFSEC